GGQIYNTFLNSSGSNDLLQLKYSTQPFRIYPLIIVIIFILLQVVLFIYLKYKENAAYKSSQKTLEISNTATYLLSEKNKINKNQNQFF
ncbi:MAG: hypothetical protein H7196_00405, partial [candidate division SR1 bacterium]|nr:hypothetical protein [candidate division SR1 bacterium]